VSAKTNSSAVVNTGFTAKLEHRLEGLLFNRRVAWLLVFAALSLLLGWQASRLQPDASFQKMVPAQHPFVLNYLRYENDLRPLGNNVRIVVENTTGEIYSAEYLAKRQRRLLHPGRRPRQPALLVDPQHAVDGGHRRRLARRADRAGGLHGLAPAGGGRA
jgi:hypothetical protein